MFGKLKTVSYLTHWEMVTKWHKKWWRVCFWWGKKCTIQIARKMPWIYKVMKKSQIIRGKEQMYCQNNEWVLRGINLQFHQTENFLPTMARYSYNFNIIMNRWFKLFWMHSLPNISTERYMFSNIQFNITHLEVEALLSLGCGYCKG